MEKQPEHVSLTISLVQGAELSDKVAVSLARWLRRSPEAIRNSLESRRIRIAKAVLSDDLEKVISTLRKHGLNVAVMPLDGDSTTRTGNEISLGTTGRLIPRFGPRSSHGDWKKGEIIEGLYEVLGSAAGGMGKVYFVFHRLWKMMLAIKTPLQIARTNEARTLRFLREAELWVNLGVHPNIATCYYARVIEGLPRLFIEYVDGGSLDDWIEKNRLKDLRTVADLMLQFCHGMMYAEEKGLIHRDIKPANCLISSDRTLKVTDFGLVKRVDGPEAGEHSEDLVSDKTTDHMLDGGITVFEGGVVGSPWYMAPERFREHSRQDIRADIYSFGVMLYEIVVNEMPFEFPDGFSIPSLVKSHLRVAPIDPLSVRPDLPRSIVHIIMTCLEKKPENRYQSFVDVCEALEAFSRDLRPRREIRSRPNLVGLKADSLNNQAVSLLDLGREEEARMLLEDAHSSNTDHLEAVYNLYMLRWEKGETSDREVINRMESLKIEVRGTADFAHFMGLIALQRGDPARAVLLLEQACNLSPHRKERWDENGEDPRTYVRSLGFEPIGEQASFAGHVKTVLAVAIAPGAAKAFSVGEDRSVRFWDVGTGRCLKNLRTFTLEPVAAGFSPDGRLAATAYGDAFKTLDLWDTSETKLVRRYPGMGVFGVTFSLDGKHMAAFRPDGRVRILETFSEKVAWEFEDQWLNISFMAFLANTGAVAIGEADGTLRVRNFRTGEELFKVSAHDGPVLTIEASRDGSKIITGGADETICLWDARSGARLRQFFGHRRNISSARFTPDGKYVVSTSADGTLKVWDAASGRCYRTLSVQGEELTCCAVSSGGARILTGGAHGSVRVWSLDTRWFEADFLEPAVCRPKTFRELAVLHDTFKQAVEDFNTVWRKGQADHAREVFERVRSIPGFCWSQEAILIRNCLESASRRGRLQSSSFIRSFHGHRDAVVSLGTSDTSLRLVTGSLDGTAVIWDVITGRSVIKIHVDSPVKETFFLPNMAGIVTWSNDGILRLWDLDGNLLRDVQDVQPPIRPAGNGWRVVAVAQGNTPVEIDLQSGISTPMGSSIPGCECTCFSHDLEVLYSLKDGKRILRWSVDNGRNVGALREIGLMITAMLPSGSNEMVVAGLEDGEVVAYVGGSGVNVLRLRGHTEPVRTLACSKDPNLWLSGSDDCSLRLWDTSEEKCLVALEGHSSAVRAAGFFPNLSMIASGGSDGSVRLWGLEWELLPA